MKRDCIERLLFAVLLLLAVNGYAAERATEQLTGLLEPMHAFRADFIQTSQDADGVTRQQIKGTLAAMRPGLFYWQTEPPFPQQIVSDGAKLWVYDPDLEQVTVQPLDPQLSQTPVLLLSGEIDALAASYEVTLRQAEQLQVFVLRPKASESLFEQLELTFAGEQLLQMDLVDALAQRTRVEFMNVEINIDLPAELFQFTPPPGVDVISQ